MGCSGSETDVCVLATVDTAYRVVLVRDAVCSSSDAGHDALLTLYHERFSEQIVAASAAEVLAAWPNGTKVFRGALSGVSG